MTDSAPSFVGIKFCQECNNMLYPTEDAKNKQLLYCCRNCNFKMVADNWCVYVNKLKNNINELEQINSDIISDPTLPRSYDHACPRCDFHMAVFFQSQSTNSDNMQLYYVCCSPTCGYKWIE